MQTKGDKHARKTNHEKSGISSEKSLLINNILLVIKELVRCVLNIMRIANYGDTQFSLYQINDSIKCQEL